MRRRRNSLLPSSDSYQKHLCGRVPNRFFGSRIPANSVQQAMVVLSEPPETTRNAYGTACPTCLRVSSTVVLESTCMHAHQEVGAGRSFPVPILQPSIAKEIHGCYCWTKLRLGPQVAGSDVRSQSTVMGTPSPDLRLRHCGHCCRVTTCRTKNCRVLMVFAEICWFLATILLMVRISSCQPTAGKVQTCQIANPMPTTTAFKEQLPNMKPDKRPCSYTNRAFTSVSLEACNRAAPLSD